MDRGSWQATVHGGHKESDTTERFTHTHTHTHTHHNMLVVLDQDLGRFPQMLSQLEAYGLQKHLF